MNERLPKFEAQLRAEANSSSFITTTINCSVSVFVKPNSNDTGYHNINKISNLQMSKRDNLKRKYCHHDDNTVDDDGEKSPDFKNILSC